MQSRGGFSFSLPYWQFASSVDVQGVPCDLHTGEELQFANDDEDYPSPHLSCTVEMAHISHDHVCKWAFDWFMVWIVTWQPHDTSDDVAVIDEIQMIEDLQRGGAWTRALLGGY